MPCAYTMMTDVLDAYEAWEDGTPKPKILIEDGNVPISAALGRLWNCRDWMPSRLRRDILHHIRWNERQHSETSLGRYSQAARIMRRRVDEALAR